jgi:hypothetical protein
MSATSSKAGGSGSKVSLPFVSVDIPADFERAATAAPKAGGSGSEVSLPFVSVDIPADFERAATAAPKAGGSYFLSDQTKLRRPARRA